jgi:predicted nucleic acid-binding protein
VSGLRIHDNFGVVLDTCVLYPSRLRDVLLDAAIAGLYRPLWSEEILEELRSNLVENGDQDEPGAQRLVDAMRDIFPEAIVTGYEMLIPSMGTRDPDDRHVLAAAVCANAQLIVTNNTRDFPAKTLEPLGKESQTADEFLQNLFHLYLDGFVTIMEQLIAKYTRPSFTFDEFLARLSKSVPGFVALVRTYLTQDPDPGGEA